MTEATGVVRAAPRWFEALVLCAAGALAAVGLVGLALALVGEYRTVVVLVIGAPMGLAMAWVMFRAVPVGRPVARSGHAPAAVAVAVAGLFVVVASWQPAQHVVIDRDPGSYLTTGRWLARDGGLSADVSQGGLHDDEVLRRGGAAVFAAGDTDVEFQFAHLAPVLLAAAYDIGTPFLMFRLPAVVMGLGLLAIYAVATRAVGRPWVALLAPVATACLLPVMFVARDTYSEPFALTLVWTAALAGCVAADTARPSAWVLPGAIFGAAVATRPDSLLALAAAGPMTVGYIVAGSGSDRTQRLRGAGVFAGTAAVGSVLAVFDLWGASTLYAKRHGPQVVTAAVIALVATSVAIVAAWLTERGVRPTTVLRRARDRIALLGALAVGGGLLAAWFIRPHVQTMRGKTEVDLIEVLQKQAGQAVDPARRYGEMSVEWLSWYLGPIGLAVAVLGVGLAVRSVIRAESPRALSLVTSAFLVVGPVVLWRPNITPDQVWAMRRFVPVVLPALAVLAVHAVTTLAGASDRGRWRLTPRPALALVLSAALVVGAAAVAWPVRSLREHYGKQPVIEQACSLMGPDASVVVLGTSEAATLPQSLRSWCGVPAKGVREEVTVEDLGPVRAAVEAAGRTLVLVSANPDLIAGQGIVQVTGTAVETHRAERTLLRAPSRYADPDGGWTLGVVRVDG